MGSPQGGEQGLPTVSQWMDFLMRPPATQTLVRKLAGAAQTWRSEFGPQNLHKQEKPGWQQEQEAGQQQSPDPVRKLISKHTSW